MYLKLVSSRAFRETKHFWSPQKTMIAVLSPILAAVLRGFESSWNRRDVIVTAWLTAVAVAILWVITFLYELLRAPALLHREQQAQIDGQSRVIIRLRLENAISKVDPHEEETRQYVSDKMADFTPEERKAVRALLTRGEIHRKDAGKIGFPADLFFSAMEKGICAGFVKERDDRHHGGIEQSYYINLELKSALEYYFATNS